MLTDAMASWRVALGWRYEEAPKSLFMAGYMLSSVADGRRQRAITKQRVSGMGILDSFGCREIPQHISEAIFPCKVRYGQCAA